MSKKVAFTRFDGHNLTQFDEDGQRIVDLSDPLPYKPTYDVEISGTQAPYKTTIYFDVHTKLYEYESVSLNRARLRAAGKILLHKYVLRFFTRPQEPES